MPPRPELSEFESREEVALKEPAVWTFWACRRAKRSDSDMMLLNPEDVSPDEPNEEPNPEPNELDESMREANWAAERPDDG